MTTVEKRVGLFCVSLSGKSLYFDSQRERQSTEMSDYHNVGLEQSMMYDILNYVVVHSVSLGQIWPLVWLITVQDFYYQTILTVSK